MNHILTKLSEKFPREKISWRVFSRARDNSSWAMPVLNVRDVRARFDDAVGMENWSYRYAEVASENKAIAVRCELSVVVGANLLAKSEVAFIADGVVSEANLKAAYEEAFKRAAAQWGIGVYLQAFKPVQVTLDPTTGKPLETLILPDEFVLTSVTPTEKQSAAKAPPASQPTAPAASASTAANLKDSKSEAPAAPAQPVADSTASQPSAEASPGGDAEEAEMAKNPLVADLLAKLQKIPVQMVRSYIEGPKGKEKLSAAERAFLLKRVSAKEAAAPVAAA